MSAGDFLTKEERSLIVKSIEKAELNTSGEIRVHIESVCKEEDPVKRAVYVFDKLKMYKTAQRNGVLIYLAYKSRKFAIIGDSGINEKVPAGFWDNAKDRLLTNLKEGKVVDGLCEAIDMAGVSLKNYFPYQTDDINEQSNEISFGE